MLLKDVNGQKIKKNLNGQPYKKFQKDSFL